jgi:hypothetical protein
MMPKERNTRVWLEECQMRYVDMDAQEHVSITVGEFRALVDQGFKMMDFADQLVECLIEIQRLEKFSDEDRA